MNKLQDPVVICLDDRIIRWLWGWSFPFVSLMVSVSFPPDPPVTLNDSLLLSASTMCSAPCVVRW
jgi:hypothetical protein